MLKTVSSVTNAIGALNYKGTWNASTNSPTLTSGVGTKGDYYVVSVAGSTNLDGETLWGVGDWAAFNGSTWQKVDGGDSGNFVNISVSALTGYMYANGTSNVTASTTIPVANVTGLGTMATQNAISVAITGGNAVFTTANTTNSTITNLSSGNVTITGGTENNVTYTNVSVLSGNVKANLTITNSTSATATYATASLPLVPAGFIQLQLANATVVKVPYYAS